MKPQDDAGMRIVDVDDLSNYIRDLFDSDPILDDIWVRGEVSNFRRSPSGHYYFLIKSANSQLKSVLFKGNAALVTHLPENGEAILAHGRVSTYPAYGEYQLYVDQILPEGAGLLQLQFEELRKRLEAEGLFEPSRKRALPAHPTFIGVVTSATGSVWHDIQDVLRRRYPLAELILSPALVQGDAAPDSIVQALQRLIDDARAEVVIVGRGGGSIEDLWSFNDERVIRAIFRCPIPVVSAVGHETDVTLTDLVADVRAPTPSAAAEIVAPHVREYRQHLRAEVSALGAVVSRGFAERRHSLQELQRRLSSHDPQWKLQQERLRVDRLGESLNRRLDQRLTRERSRAEAFSRNLALLDPRQLLGRGYALMNDPGTGRRIRGIDDLTVGARLRLTLSDGRAHATVDDVEAMKAEDDQNER